MAPNDKPESDRQADSKPTKTASRSTDTETGPDLNDAPSGSVPAAGCDSASGAMANASGNAQVADFIAKMKQMAPPTLQGRGRLIFAMDATMSRQPTWDMALALQGEMFQVVKQVGGLDVQLIFFRGAGECRSSKWVSDPDALARLMTSVSCRGGYTQIGKVLTHARRETDDNKVSALVYVGDCMEEDIDDLCGRAGELALLGLPVFMFQEGNNVRAATGFAEIARLTKGAYCSFDAGSASQLRELLSAVAVYAAGGRRALEALLEDHTRGTIGVGARKLLEQLR